MLFQAGPDRIAFSYIDSRQATGFALADEYIDPRASELRPAPGVDKQGAGTNDTQSRPVGLLNEAEAVGQQGRIVISSDGGSSWEPAGEGIEEPMTDMVEVFLAGPDGSVWAICAAGRLFRAEPGEWVWQSVGLPEGITVESVCFVG